MPVDLPTLMDRVARAFESVVPQLSLTPEISSEEWVEYREDGKAPEVSGEWLAGLGFKISYRGVCSNGAFQVRSSGTDRDRLEAVALQLMSNVQDDISEATANPWPLAMVNGSKDMAMADASIEGDYLYLWYGERSAPAVRLPPISLM